MQRVRWIDFDQGHFGIPRDSLKHVVEIMGHPAGKTPHRLHLLGLQQLRLQFFPFRFGPFALGDVADALDGAHNVASLIVQRRGLGKNPCPLIVVKCVAENFRRKTIPFTGDFGIPGRNIPLVHEDQVHQLRSCLSIKWDRISVVSFADHLGGRNTRHLLHSLVPDNDSLFLINRKGCIRQKIDDVRQSLAVLPEFRLHPSAFGNIADCGNDDLPAFQIRQTISNLNRDSAPIFADMYALP